MQDEFRDKDYYRWDYYIKRLGESDLDEHTKSTAIGSIDELRRIFDDTWMKECLLEHPISGYFLSIDSIPYSLLWVTDFGQKLREFKTYDNFDEVEKRLKISSEFLGAKAELDVAWIIKKCGYRLTFIRKDQRTFPDLKVEIAGEDVYVEVTKLFSTREEDKAIESHRALVDLVAQNREVHISFHLHKCLAKREIQALLLRARKAIEKSIVTKKCVEIRERIIDFVACPRDNLDEFKKWTKDVNPHGTFWGPPIELNVETRTRSRVDEKAKQIPHSSPGIIFVDGRDVIWGTAIDEYWGLADKIDQTVYDYPNLLAVAVLGPLDLGSGNSQTKIKKVSKGDYTVHLIREFGDALLIVKNKHSDFKELLEQVDKLFEKATIS